MNVNFLRAADAFLYLPLYIAEKLEIIENIDSTLIPNFSTPTRDKKRKGDIVALEELLEQSKKRDSIPIAVCDPSAMFDSSLSSNTFDFRVLGAMITKLPFWAVDGLDIEVKDEKNLSGKFKSILYYYDELKTGSFIGKRTKDEAGISVPIQVNFGQEFNILMNEDQGPTLAVTADIISLALHKDNPKKKIKINHYYSTNEYYKDFITTALVTTKSVCAERHAELEKILEGVQYALAILLSSKKTAISVCKEISKNKDFYHIYHEIDHENPEFELDECYIKYIIELMYAENFYSENLKISRERWESTINCHLKNASEGSTTWNLLMEGKKRYEEIVASNFLLEGQKRFVKNVGINIEEISEETTLQRINAEKTEIQQVYETEKQSLVKLYDTEKQSLTKSSYMKGSLLTASIFGLAFFITGILTPFYQIFSQGLLPYLGVGLVIMFPTYAFISKYGLPRASVKSIKIWLTFLTLAFFASSLLALGLVWKYQGDEFAKYSTIPAYLFGAATLFAGLLGGLYLALIIQQHFNDSK